MGEQRLHRRALLAVGGLAALSACRAIPGAGAGAASRGSAVTLGASRAGIRATAVAAFERTHGHVRLITGAASATLPYQLVKVGRSGGPLPVLGLADLTVALRALNFEPQALVPGTLATWTEAGRILGVPVSVSPWGVRWRTEAFAAAAATGRRLEL